MVFGGRWHRPAARLGDVEHLADIIPGSLSAVILTPAHNGRVTFLAGTDMPSGILPLLECAGIRDVGVLPDSRSWFGLASCGIAIKSRNPCKVEASASTSPMRASTCTQTASRSVSSWQRILLWNTVFPQRSLVEIFIQVHLQHLVLSLDFYWHPRHTVFGRLNLAAQVGGDVA